jgi:flavin reductase (DIM6/NTAB) family NADH-FMN oxidoreductase RutF
MAASFVQNLEKGMDFLHKKGAFLTVKSGDKVNTMTASWGGLGVMWYRNVAYVVIRPQRYTKEFIDAQDNFSITSFDDSFKKQLGYLGSVSGRNEDKITKSGLTLKYIDGIPYFEEANLVITCKKLFSQPFLPENFHDKSLIQECYPNKDYHTLYIGEITKVLKR